MPSLFETVVLPEAGHEHVPESDVPYFLAAGDGPFFLVKPTEIGQVILPERTTTATEKMPKLGHAGGVFTWQGQKVPASIISQAHDFFLRIFTKHHTEAEVLITKHRETSEFRLFVPYQRVSHAGVKSIYEPTHVSRQYTVVGTLHSHCDFSAFHSGTDSGDASDMDGVHFTIGKVTEKEPEIVSMVAMNGKEFHYKNPSDIADIAWGTQTAPPWWDTYVFANNDAPRIKPRSLISLTQEHWDEFLGRALVKPKPITTTVVSPYQPRNDWSQRTVWPQRHKDYKDEDWRRLVYGSGRKTPDVLDPITNPEIDYALDLAEDLNVFWADEWDDIKEQDKDSVGYWQGFFATRLNNVAEVLQTLGIDVRITIPTEKVDAPTNNSKGKRK